MGVNEFGAIILSILLDPFTGHDVFMMAIHFQVIDIVLVNFISNKFEDGG